jgi:hypothetical protein
MFRSSRILHAPVVTLLSPSLSASKKAMNVLSMIGRMEPISSTATEVEGEDDPLNKIFQSSIPGLSKTWNSIGLYCPISRSVIHFCSLSTATTKKGQKKTENDDEEESTSATISPFALLSITESNTDDNNPMKSIQYCRKLLAQQLEASIPKNLKFNLKYLMKGEVTPIDLLRHNVSADGLPFLSLETIDKSSSPTTQNTVDTTNSPTFLKEIVVPFFDYAEYNDGSTILSKLGQAGTKRPAVGVYQWPTSVTCIRPLPTAGEDKRLPSPSLIFHSNSPDNEIAIANVDKTGIRKAPIGFSGGMTDGQIMVRHEHLLGLDIRYCHQTKVKSAFCEAQESLLAGSLEELQSTNALLSRGEQAKDDHRTNNSDCWVEVRANLKQPSGYWTRASSKRSGSIRVAKVPDLPYE